MDILTFIQIFGSQYSGLNIGLSGPSGSTAGLFDKEVLFGYFDMENFKALTAGTVSRTGNVLYFDSSEGDLVKTKKVAINKLLSDSYQTFVGKGSKVVVEKGTDTVQFDVATGGVTSTNQNLITGATAYEYITQNTVASFDGKTGNITVVDGGTY